MACLFMNQLGILYSKRYAKVALFPNKNSSKNLPKN